MSKPRRPRQAEADVRSFNAKFPVGSQVLAWTGLMGEGPGKLGTVSEPAFVYGSIAVVRLDGILGWVATSHVAPAA